jgi:uncharacterized membrane protein
MLQVPNILRRPRVLLPAVIASVITGPLATVVFRLENSPLGSGMGTSGLVGPITTWITMKDGAAPLPLLLTILAVCFLLPAVIALASSELLRKIGWIRAGDMKLEL